MIAMTGMIMGTCGVPTAIDRQPKQQRHERRIEKQQAVRKNRERRTGLTRGSNLVYAWDLPGDSFNRQQSE